MQNKRLHKTNAAWSIWLPFISGILLLGFLTFLLFFSGVQGKGDVTNLSSIAIIVILFPLMVLGIFGFLFLTFLIRTILRFSIRLPGWMQQFSTYAEKWLNRINSFSKLLIQTYISLNLRTHAVKTVIQSLKKK